MAHPAYTPAEARSRETFLALMWALSYPGRIYSLPAGAALDSIAMTLLDLETSFYTPDPALADQLARTRARLLTPSTAAYHFYPTLDAAALDAIAQASPGSMLFPDEAATLIIVCSLTTGLPLRFSGPGVPGEQRVQLPLPEQFWELRARSTFPMGWDVLLLDGIQVMGLPRSTRVQG